VLHHARASPLAFQSPNRHSLHAAEFFELTWRGLQQLLQRGVLHHAQPLACHHPPSPLHPSAACWLPQFPARLAMAADGAMFSGVFQKLFLSVSYVCCVRCNGYIRMLEVHVSSILVVSDVCFTRFICMFHVFILMLHMLQWLYTYVLSVCSTCVHMF
jgi:hypothetical protein